MTKYSFLQIIDFFMIYCFLGWIWETCYVSIKQKKLINRGFLHGPVIPIYGFAAMSVLSATLPFKAHLWAVFIAGFLAASAMELVTGITMEALFGVRYWDYRRYKLNIKGYVSLPTSTVWGLFSVLLIKFLHTNVESLVLGMNQLTTEIVTMVLACIMSADFALASREALDLKELLKHIMELETVQKATKKANAVVSILDTDKEIIMSKIEEKVAVLGKMESWRIKSLIDRNPSITAASAKSKEIFEMVKSGIVNAVKNKLPSSKNNNAQSE